MKNEPVVKRMKRLCQLDIDAVRAYEQAIEKIEHPEIRARITEFQADHERHITELSEAIRRLGGEPPSRSPDLKGVLLEGFTALRSVTGTEGALKAMRTNEKLTNKTYEDALGEQGTTEDVHALIQRNRDDERRHLEYIERTLQTKPWEHHAHV